MSTCLTLGVTLLASTTEIKLVLSYQFTAGAPVWSAKASVYLLIALVLLTELYIYLFSPSSESEAIAV